MVYKKCHTKIIINEVISVLINVIKLFLKFRINTRDITISVNNLLVKYP